MHKNLYLSPHLDDVALSCAGVIKAQVSRGEKVAITSIFSADCDSQPSDLAKRIHGIWRLGPKPYVTRRQEDVSACSLLGCGFWHLEETEAIYRSTPDGSPLYPTLDSIFDRVADTDHWFSDLCEKINRVNKEFSPTHVYAPLGLSKHVDHQVVLAAALALFEHQEPRLAFYEEWPYASDGFPVKYCSSIRDAITRLGLRQDHSFTERIDVESRVQVALCYKSQIEPLFRSAHRMTKMITDYATDVGQGYPSERVWLSNDESYWPTTEDIFD